MVRFCSPFAEIKRNLDERYDEWVLLTFVGGPTFRMFADFSEVGEFLRKEGPRLVNARNQEKYDKAIFAIANRFCHSKIRSSHNKERPRFGHAVKVLNLYVKHYGFCLAALGARQAKRAERLLGHAHVPLDRIVLKSIWCDFRDLLEADDIRKIPRLNKMSPEEYRSIQLILREQARKERVPAILYDFRWSEGRK